MLRKLYSLSEKEIQQEKKNIKCIMNELNSPEQDDSKKLKKDTIDLNKETLESFEVLQNQINLFHEKTEKSILLFTNHYKALRHISESNQDLMDFIPSIFINIDSIDNKKKNEKEKDRFEKKINSFNNDVIRPLQKLIDSFIKIKNQYNDRKESFEIMQRYEKKIQEMKKLKKSDSSIRMQRNIHKLQQAKDRFYQMDKNMRQEMQTILSNNIFTIFSTSSLIELINEQHKWSEEFVRSTLSIKNSVEMNLAKQDENINPSALYSESQRLSSAAETELEEMTEVFPEIIENYNNYGKKDAPINDTIPNLEKDKNLIDPPELMIPSLLIEEDSPNKNIELDIKFIDINRSNIIQETNNNNNIKTKRIIGNRTEEFHEYMKVSMDQGLDMKDCILLPKEFTIEEWISVHLIDFYNEINVLYSNMTELCTDNTCPEMSAGPCYTYLWADGIEFITPTSVTAPKYINYLMEWIEKHLKDNTNEIKSTNIIHLNMIQSKNILKRMFRVYAHIYHSHLEDFIDLHAEPHLNFCFKRFIYFVLHFELVEKKELNALENLIVTLTGTSLID